MSLSFAGLNLFKDWVATTTGLPKASVVWEAPVNAPRRERPYISLRFGSVRSVGEDCVTPMTWPTPTEETPWPDGTRRWCGDREATLSIQAHYPGVTTNFSGVNPLTAYASLETLRSRMRTDEARAVLLAAGLVAYLLTTPIMDLNEFFSPEYEQRAAWDLPLRFGTDVAEVIERVRGVGVTVSALEDGQDPLTESFTVEAA